MTQDSTPIRYTLNRDGTLEKWWLEKDMGNEIALRKTPTPRWNCNLRIWPASEVYASAKAARAARKEARP